MDFTPNGKSRLRVLVVEDEPDCADSEAILLGMYGYEVRVAADAATALAECVAWQPDAVLMDIRLPDMSGWRLAEQIRGLRQAHRPLLMAVTAAGQPEDRIASTAAGIDLHWVKPIDPAALRTLLDQLHAVIR